MKISNTIKVLLLSFPAVTGFGVFVLLDKHEDIIIHLMIFGMIINPISLLLLWKEKGGPLVTLVFGLNFIWLVLSLLGLGAGIAMHSGWG